SPEDAVLHGFRAAAPRGRPRRPGRDRGRPNIVSAGSDDADAGVLRTNAVTITALVTAALLVSQGRPPVVAQRGAPQPAPFGGGEPQAVLGLEKQWAGADALVPLLTSQDRAIKQYAIRAIGRLEVPSLAPRLIAVAATDPAIGPQAAAAVAQSLRGFKP